MAVSFALNDYSCRNIIPAASVPGCTGNVTASCCCCYLILQIAMDFNVRTQEIQNCQ